MMNDWGGGGGQVFVISTLHIKYIKLEIINVNINL